MLTPVFHFTATTKYSPMFQCHCRPPGSLEVSVMKKARKPDFFSVPIFHLQAEHP